MKIFFRALCILLAVIVLGLGALVIWQKDNLVSYVNSKKYSQEELTAQIAEKKEELNSIVNSYTDLKIRDFTEEEEKQILDGKVTPDEVLQKILKESGIDYEQWQKNSEAIDSSNQNQDQDQPVIQSPQPQNNQDSVNEIVNLYVSKMYSLKGQYLARLGELKRQMISDYNALPKESHNSAGKQEIVSKYLGKFSSLEAECDGNVNALLNSLTSQLQSVNGDLSIVSSMRKAYQDEKNLMKSYYMNSK